MTKKRRPKGSGSVFKRGEIWWFKYSLHGKVHFESSRSRTKSEAERQLKIRIGAIASGDFRASNRSRLTMTHLFGMVVSDYEARKLKSVYDVKLRVNNALIPALGNVRVSMFNTNDVNGYIKQRRAAGMAEATINRELSIIRRGFALGMELDPPIVLRAPKIIKLKENNTREGFLEPEQYRALLAEMPDHLKAFLVVGYHLGMRKGEMRSMEWKQVDLEAGEIKLPRGKTKGNQARTAPIYGDMGEWLAKQKAYRDEYFPDCPWVFHWAGRQIGSHTKGWREACIRAGVPTINPHDLRRSAIRQLERAGVSRSVAKAISGHKTDSVYQRYDIVSSRDMETAKTLMNKFLKEQE